MLVVGFMQEYDDVTNMHFRLGGIKLHGTLTTCNWILPTDNDNHMTLTVMDK